MSIKAAYYCDGELTPADSTANSLRELAVIEPEGVYTITRTYEGNQTVLLDAHFDRLEESARLEGMSLAIDRDGLRSALRQLIKHAGFPDSRLRLTITKQRPECITLAAEPLQPIPEIVKQRGITVATVALARTNPRAKSNTWEQQRAEAARHLPAEVFEGLLVDDAGRILEGFSSNFYGITNLSLQTADEGILRGITRRILLEILPTELDLHTKPIKMDQLHLLDEAFISSSSRGLVPVVKIDEHQIGSGRPGNLTKALSTRYDEWVESNLELI